MKFYNINTQGKMWLQRLDTLPETTIEDEGRIVYNKQSKTIYFHNDEGWIEFTTSVPNTITRGLFAGGYYIGPVNSIEYLNIASLGSSGYDFGDLTSSRSFLAGTSNSTNQRGVFMGGQVTNVIDYVTINILSNAGDFGDLTVARSAHGAASNNTNERAICSGGYISIGPYVSINVIDYVTINTTGNASDFGDLTETRIFTASCSNGTNDRGITWQGQATNTIDYVTISSTGNASDFGDVSSTSRYSSGSTSNFTNERGILAGGYNSGDFNIIDYITINTPGDSSDFGDLTLERYELSGVSNGTDERGMFGGGRYHPGGAPSNVIDYITINTTGNASDFGDLLEARPYTPATCSG